MTDLRSKLRDSLHQALDSARRRLQRTAGSAPAAAARTPVAGARAPDPEPPRPRTIAVSGARRSEPVERTGDVATLSEQLDLLTEHFADQAQALAGLGRTGATNSASIIDALRQELEAAKQRVRASRVRVGTRVAGQIKSAHHLATRARRLDDRLRNIDERRTRLLDLELGIAGAESTLMASEVALAEATTRLAARERELTQCTTERALLEQHRFAVPTARAFAVAAAARVRERLHQLRSESHALRRLDASAQRGTPAEMTLSGLLDVWNAALEQCAEALVGKTATPAAPASLRLEPHVLRSGLEQRLRLLEALAEIRVEETQALHASRLEALGASHAAYTQVSSLRICLLLDDAERAWLLESLRAVEREQAARLEPPAALAAAEAYADALAAWRVCDGRLQEAAVQARAAHLELATLRTELAPALAHAETEARELGARVRERQRTLRSRAREIERAQSRLRLALERNQALERRLRRARRSLDHAHGRLPPTLSQVSRALTALERDVETAAAVVTGVHKAHELSLRVLRDVEHALLDLHRRRHVLDQVRAPDRRGEAAWAQARMQLEIAGLTQELESWKARHALLEARVQRQAALLEKLERSVREDEAMAELRNELESARASAAESLERALALTAQPHPTSAS